MASWSPPAGSRRWLVAAGLEPEIVEPEPGRGSVHARLRGDGTGGEPLLLLSHLDVVPAPPERWSHDPFAADLADGYVYGRGAVDMKAMIAMELGVVRLLAAEARAAGLDPARDPIPGLRRDVLFTCTADEEAGGHDRREVGRRAATRVAPRAPAPSTSAAASRRRWPAAGSTRSRSPRRASPPIGSRSAGRGATARCRATTTRRSWRRPSSSAWPFPGPTRITPVMARFLELAAAALPADAAALLRGLSGDDPSRAEAALAAACDPMYARALRALLRDTISPDVVHAGIKYNVIPGDAMVEVDCRVLPGTTEPAMRAELVERLGPELAAACQIELIVFGAPVEAPAEGPLFDLLVATIRDHDPDGIPLPVMAPFATDAKHTDALGTPTYGFSPLRLDPDERFLERFHGVDERVSVDALRWGLPVLYDVVRRFCG